MLHVVPVTLDEANAYVEAFHRHTGPMPLPTARFACAVVDEAGSVLGVAIAGHTSARLLMDRCTLEVNRVCSDGAPNVCSRLYAAVVRAGTASGTGAFVTYTLAAEGGLSLRASGWQAVATVPRDSWKAHRHRGAARADRYHPGDRVRWEIHRRPAPVLQWPPLPPSPQLGLFT